MKYYIKESKEEIKLGDVLEKISMQKTPYGVCKTVIDITVTKNNIDQLIKEGLIITENNPNEEITIKIIGDKISKKLGWSVERAKEIFETLDTHYKAPVFSIFLKEIAIVLDKKYSDHISKCKQFYYVSLCDGLIHNTTTAPANFNCIALFRSFEDAQKALELVKDLHKDLFPGIYEGKQEN